MPLRISIHATGALVGSTIGFIADAAHSHYLRHQAVQTLKTNNLAIHVFHSQDCSPNSFYREQAYPIAGHYYDAGHRHSSQAQGDLVLICPFKAMYETPTKLSAKIKTVNHQVAWHETATWPHLLNLVEVQVADEQAKPIAAYLEKMMKRESYTGCGFHAIELSELARHSSNRTH